MSHERKWFFVHWLRSSGAIALFTNALHFWSAHLGYKSNWQQSESFRELKMPVKIHACHDSLASWAVLLLLAALALLALLAGTPWQQGSIQDPILRAHSVFMCFLNCAFYSSMAMTCLQKRVQQLHDFKIFKKTSHIL